MFAAVRDRVERAVPKGQPMVADVGWLAKEHRLLFLLLFLWLLVTRLVVLAGSWSATSATASTATSAVAEARLLVVALAWLAWLSAVTLWVRTEEKREGERSSSLV